MSAMNFNLRGIPSEVMDLLKQEAKRLHTSVNALILTIVERGVGFSRARTTFHDLDDLAGGWSDDDVKTFEKNTKFFEQIDEDIWS